MDVNDIRFRLFVIDISGTPDRVECVMLLCLFVCLFVCVRCVVLCCVVFVCLFVCCEE